MFQCFYPNEDYGSAYEIDYEKFYEKGYRGIIYDIDNTLVPHGAPADDRSIALFTRLEKIGYDVLLLSNNKEYRVTSFQSKVRLETGLQDKLHAIWKAKKPLQTNYIRAMEMMDTDATNTLFIGDQLFTDVYGAKKAGIYSILVAPIDKKEEIQIVIKRFFEKIILAFYKRRKRKGISS